MLCYVTALSLSFFNMHNSSRVLISLLRRPTLTCSAVPLNASRIVDLFRIARFLFSSGISPWSSAEPRQDLILKTEHISAWGEEKREARNKFSLNADPAKDATGASQRITVLPHGQLSHPTVVLRCQNSSARVTFTARVWKITGSLLPASDIFHLLPRGFFSRISWKKLVVELCVPSTGECAIHNIAKV